MNQHEIEKESARRAAVFDQQKAEIREATLKFISGLSVAQFDGLLADLSLLKSKSTQFGGAHGVVLEIGLLEMDILLNQWMAERSG